MEKIIFYGTRGASSLTSEEYMEFGGATSCIMFNLHDTALMVDCGSGINNALDNLKDIKTLHILISHCHIDHITGILTLLPRIPNTDLHIYSKKYGGGDIKDAIKEIAKTSLWPVTDDIFNNVTFHSIEDNFTIDDISISVMDSNHPGGCSLFRIQNGEDDIVTAFDFCHLNGYDQKLIDFAKGCKVMIYDGNLREDELNDKYSWGHSTPEAGVRIAKELNLEQLYITHFSIYDDATLIAWEERLKEDYPNVTFARSGIYKNSILKILEIGSAINLEKDNDKLLTKIVDTTMDITNADGGTLYLYENGKLEFKVMLNRSKGLHLVKKQASLNIPPVEMDGKNVCAAAARDKTLINIDDCYKTDKYDFSGVRKYDELNDYLTRSVLAVPLIDDNDELIGVLQLINSKDRTGDIIPFSKHIEEVIISIANQAALSIVNYSYSSKINDLLYGFVKVMSVGIDERTPYNANHTKNMIRFAENFFSFEKENHSTYEVDSTKQREIMMSIWLHDIGKILTPLQIMNKNTRLGNIYNELAARFQRRDLLLRLELAENKIDSHEYHLKQEERLWQLEQINRINRASFLTDELKDILNEIASKTYNELDGSPMLVLTMEEYHHLTTIRGTLTREERAVMEDHVVKTQKLLSQLQFPRNYEMIPVYAGNHHEFLDGSGYPNHLTSKDLPWPCRLITVLDIFEALTATDRPYKKPIPVEDSLAILRDMARQGKLDAMIVEEFEKAKPWINTQEKPEDPIFI